MASALTDKLSRLVKEMRGQARMTESNVQDMLREVRMALLEADVAVWLWVTNFIVVRGYAQHVIGALGLEGRDGLRSDGRRRVQLDLAVAQPVRDGLPHLGTQVVLVEEVTGCLLVDEAVVVGDVVGVGDGEHVGGQ